MVYDTIEKLKEKLERIRFGILKTTGNPLLKLSKSFIIETLEVDHNGYVWCLASDSLPSGLVEEKGFAAQLKYVNKPEGLFIKVTAHATVITANSPEGKRFQEIAYHAKHKNASLLKVKIDEVHYYRKKAISAYTSFLQAINNVTFKKPVLE